MTPYVCFEEGKKAYERVDLWILLIWSVIFFRYTELLVVLVSTK